MPAPSPEESLWKKRKREDDLSLPRPTTYVPSFRVEEYDCAHPLQDSNLRTRCLPRKRRHISPYLPQKVQHQPSTHLSPNVYTTDPYSPPISPKSLVPIHYPQSASPSVLRPCHICHRRPTTRQVLNAYADCDMCNERACFICLRQCDSPNCRTSTAKCDEGDTENSRRKICSACAVEDITQDGTEIVRCLDCVRECNSQWALDDMHED